MKYLELTQGLKAIIDDEDFELASKFKWYAQKCAGNKTYARRSGKNGISLHRFLMNPLEKIEVDHINGDPLDNRRNNLRLCEHRDNLRNKKMKTTNKYGFKGVRIKAGKIKPSAEIVVDGKTIHLGYFDTLVQAALAYDQAATKHFGNFARLNF